MKLDQCSSYYLHQTWLPALPVLTGAWLLALLLQCLPFAALGQASDRLLLFVGNNKIPPILSVENQQPVGLAVDLAHALAEKAHLFIQVEAMDWPEAQARVLEGTADALLQINPNPEREKLYDFSDVLLESHFHLFRLNTRPEIQDLTSLYGKKVGVEAGGFPIQYLKQYAQIDLVIIPNWKAGFDSLAAGRLDAIFVDRWVGEYQLYHNKIHQVVVVEPAIVTDKSRIAVKKGNRELLDRINFGLQAIEQNGVRQQIQNRWRAKEIIYLTRESVDRLALWAALGGIALLIGILLKILHDARAIKQINRELVERSNALTRENEERQQAEAALRQAHDILEQRVAERAAELRGANAETRQSAAHLQALFNSALDAILIANDDGEYVDANPAACALLGYSRDELLRLSVWEVTPASLRDEIEARWRQFGAEGEQRGEYTLQRKDGGERTVEYRAVAHFLPGRHLSILRDITERKQAEVVLQQQAGQLQTQAKELRIQARELQAQTEELHAQTEELHAQNQELDRFNRAMIGRELDMIRLKQQVNDLSAQLGQAAPYALDFLNSPDPAIAGDAITLTMEPDHDP